MGGDLIVRHFTPIHRHSETNIMGFFPERLTKAMFTKVPNYVDFTLDLIGIYQDKIRIIKERTEKIRQLVACFALSLFVSYWIKLSVESIFFSVVCMGRRLDQTNLFVKYLPPGLDDIGEINKQKLSAKWSVSYCYYCMCRALKAVLSLRCHCLGQSND